MKCFGDLEYRGEGRQIGLRNQFKPLPVGGSDLGSFRRLFLRHTKLFSVFPDVRGNNAFNLHS